MTADLLTRPPTTLFPGAAPVHDTAPLCPIGQRPHAATDGLICWEHLEELSTWLRDIEREAADLNPVPSTSTRYDGSGGGALASQRSPANLDAIAYTDQRSTLQGHRHVGPVCQRCLTLAGRRCSCPSLPWRRQDHWVGCPRGGVHPSCLAILDDRDEHEAHAERLVSVLNVLHGLAQHVRDEREFGIPVKRILVRVPPGHEGVYAVDRHGVVGAVALVPADVTVASERDVLSRNLGWIARQPWVLELRAELAALRRQLLAANHNQDDEPLPGHCTWLVDGRECRGDLWPTEPEYSTGYETTDGTRAVVCGRNDSHRYEGADLARLSVVIQQQRREEQAS